MKEGMVMLFPAAASLDMTSLDFDNPIWSMVRLNGPLAHTRKECAFIHCFRAMTEPMSL